MIPEVKGKIDGVSLRVPTPDVSVVALTCVVEKATTADEVNDAFREAAKSGPLKGVLAVSDEPLVSVDYIGIAAVEHGGRALDQRGGRHAGQRDLVVRQRDGLLGPLRRPAAVRRGAAVKRTLESLDNGVARRAGARWCGWTSTVRSRTAWSPTTPASARRCRPSSTCASRGARLVLLSHLGRPKGGPDPKYSMEPVVASAGAAARRAGHLPARSRRRREAVTDDQAAPAGRRGRRREHPVLSRARRRTTPTLAERFAALGDLYVNDAFGSAHRAHASTEAVARILKPAVSGFLMERELRYLGEALHQPKRPFVAVLGGAKISGKIDLIEALLPKVDHILLGGAMACTFFEAMGLETGKSLVEPDRVELARELLKQAGEQAGAAERRRRSRGSSSAGAETRTVQRDAIPEGWAVYDIDPATENDLRRA